jgi:hypothetical protein
MLDVGHIIPVNVPLPSTVDVFTITVRPGGTHGTWHMAHGTWHMSAMSGTGYKFTVQKTRTNLRTYK